MTNIQGEKFIKTLINYRVNLIAYINSIVRDDHMAEDVFQDISAIAYQKRYKIRDEQHMVAWLRIAARQQALRVLRNQSVERRVFDDSVLDLLEGHWEKYEKYDANENIQALQECINKLTPNAQKIVNLRFQQGISGKKLADKLNRQLNTVYVALTRIYRNLAECVTSQMDKVKE